MPKKPNKFAGFRRVSGSQAGRMAVRVYVCTSCGIHHNGKKPAQCMDKACGSMAFSSFDSKGEAGRWATLVLLEGQGKLTDLKRQVTFWLKAPRRIDGLLVEVKVMKYVADFTYTRDGVDIIEDFKGGITGEAMLKLKWMEGMGLPVKLTS